MTHSNLVDLLVHRSQEAGARTAFTFMDGDPEAVVSFDELFRRASAIAAALSAQARPGDRALLIYPPGQHYVEGFLGCLLANVVAVPAYPPDPSRLDRTLPRLRGIAQDSRATTVLATSDVCSIASMIGGVAPDLADLAWMATDRVATSASIEWKRPPVSSQDAAFIQYTSGSTGHPKGVVLRHAQLIHNLDMIVRSFGVDEGTVACSWLPPYHDMGLIGGILGSIAGGAHSVLMSPITFLRRPAVWLEAISRYRALIGGGPNFAFELCLKRVTEEEAAGLDLSSWSLAFCGAEPVRADTLRRFADRFGAVGFRREAFYPCYGLAEATLLVAGGGRPASVDPAALERNELRIVPQGGRTIVSCGTVLGDQEVVIVNPATGAVLPSGMVGEICVSGGSVATEYFGRPEESREQLTAIVEGLPGRTYLRTGDLGSLADDHLFVTGRLKDLIIIRGRNLYPQDIERTAEDAHTALRRGCSAAFALEVDGSEELCVAVEFERRHHERRSSQAPPRLERRGSDRRRDPVDDPAGGSSIGALKPVDADTDDVLEAVRRAVAEQHHVRPYTVVLVRPGALPKTSSGKIQRRLTRELLTQGTLAVIARTDLEAPTSMRAPVSAYRAFAPVPPSAGAGRIVEELRMLVSVALSTPVDRVPNDVPVAELGLDSLGAVEIGHELERQFGAYVPTTVFLRDASIRDIADRIARSMEHAPVSAPTDTAAREARASAGQEAMWFQQELTPEMAAYNVYCAFELDGVLDEALLRRAMDIIVARHDVLRQGYQLTGGKLAVVELSDPVLHESIEAASLSHEELSERLAADAHRPFDLRSGPLVRVGRYRRHTGSVVLISTHHIAVDFWSLTMLLRELKLVIDGCQGGASPALPPPASHQAFITWEERRLESDGARVRSYWASEFQTLPERLDLATDRPRPARLSHRGATLARALDRSLDAKVRAFSREQGTTPFVVLLAAFQIALWRWSGTRDFAVGTPISSRTRAAFSSTVGLLINPLPIRATIDPSLTVQELVVATKRRVLDALDHQQLPLAHLVKQLKIERDVSRMPLFDVLFAYEQGHGDNDALARVALGVPGATMELGGVSARAIRVPSRAAQFDLSLLVGDTSEGLTLSFGYATDLFEEESVAAMASHFEFIVEQIVGGAVSVLDDLRLEPAEFTEAWVARHNEATRLEVPFAPLHELVAQTALTVPARIAVRCGDESITHGALDRRANALAHRLVALGAGPERPVAVLMRRGIDLLVAQLAALKVGAPFLPLDPSTPPDRLTFMVEDAATQVVVTDDPDFASSRAVALMSSRDEGEAAPPPGRRVTPSDLAYLIYTSGSTGVPKCVAVPHGAVVNLFASVRRDPGLMADDVLAAVTTTSFDISVVELFLPLVVGGTIVLLTENDVRDGARLQRVLLASGATVLDATPSLWQMLEEVGGAPPSVRAWSTGEPLPLPLATALTERHASVHNLYGPTETTVWSSLERVERGVQRVLVGRPVANTHLYVVDDRGRLLPPGIRGELCIGGAGVARGYAGRPALTAERFVPDPFAVGARMYRTGDVARYLRDGRIELFGRNDGQVKLRGYRIELGEIESRLAAGEEVAEAAALVVGERSEARIVAFAAPRSGAVLAEDTLVRGLARSLPRYMMPTRVHVVDKIARLPNGKIDRRGLLAVALRMGAVRATEPGDDVEALVCSLMGELLGREDVGPSDDFFALGGHSLVAAQLASRLSRATGADVEVRAIFEAPTAAQLAALIRAGGGAAKSTQRTRVRIGIAPRKTLELDDDGEVRAGRKPSRG